MREFTIVSGCCAALLLTAFHAAADGGRDALTHPFKIEYSDEEEQDDAADAAYESSYLFLRHKEFEDSLRLSIRLDRGYELEAPIRVGELLKASGLGSETDLAGTLLGLFSSDDDPKPDLKAYDLNGVIYITPQIAGFSTGASWGAENEIKIDEKKPVTVAEYHDDDPVAGLRLNVGEFEIMPMTKQSDARYREAIDKGTWLGSVGYSQKFNRFDIRFRADYSYPTGSGN